jgi:hypothetical protein
VCQAWSVDAFTAVGSGFYSITLPVDASSSLTAVSGSCGGSVIGTFSLRDADTGINYTGTVHLATTSGTDTAIFAVDSDDARMGAGTPITFAADDIVMVNLNYPVD